MATDTHSATNPIDFLRARYIEKKKANTHYSLTAFARDLGVSISFLSRLLRGERPLTVKLAIQIGTLLDLAPTQMERLVSSLMLQSSKNEKYSKRVLPVLAAKKRAQEETIFFEVERFKAISQWYHLAILNLTFTRDFNPSPAFISKRLGISKIETEDAIRRLIELGLLERHGKSLKVTKNSLYIKTQKSEPAIREFQLQMLEKASEILTDTSNAVFDSRCMPGTTLAVDLRKLPALKDKLRQFQTEFIEIARSSQYDEVYQMNFHFFPVTRKATTKSKDPKKRRAP